MLNPWKIISEECRIKTVGFLNIPGFVKRNKLKQIPKQQDIIFAIKKKGHKVCVTHFAKNSIRTTISEKELKEIWKNI